MQCFALPKKTLHNLDRVQRDFWWDKQNPSKAFYPKAWHKISTPKCDGGVGIRNPYRVNVSLLTRLAWRMLNNPNDLWVRVLKGKYFPRSHPFHKHRQYNSSWIWSSIRKGLAIVKHNSIWEVGNGTNIDIAIDNWIPNTGVLAGWNHPTLVTVSDLLDNNGNWDLDTIDNNFPVEVARNIKSIYVGRNLQDRLKWMGGIHYQVCL